MEPGFGDAPVAHDRDRRDFQDLGRLLHAEAPEVSQLHHLTLPPGHLSQRRERIIEGDQLRGPLLRDDGRFLQ